MQTLLLLLLTSAASAHMPVFDDDLLGKNVIDKSWAVYEVMEAGDNLLLRLNISAGENFSISVNMAGGETFEEGVDYVNVTVRGHEALSIECDPLFNGWRVLRSDRMLSGNHPDETKVIPTTTVGEPLHFEPFGVGYYRKLAACQGNVTVSDVFNVSITALKDIKLNVGVGMAEMFSFAEIILMSISIFRTWIWDGYLGQWIVYTVLLVFIIIYHYRELLRKTLVSRRGNIFSGLGLDAETAIVRSVLFFNSMQFLLRLISINLNNYAKDVDLAILIPIGVHILLPLAVAYGWGKVEHTATAFGIMLIYSSALLWSGWFVIPVFSAVNMLIQLARSVTKM